VPHPRHTKRLTGYPQPCLDGMRLHAACLGTVDSTRSAARGDARLDAYAHPLPAVPALAGDPGCACRARHRARAQRGAPLGVAPGVPRLEPGGRAPRTADRGCSGHLRRLCHFRVSGRDHPRGSRRRPANRALSRRPPAPCRGAPACRLVQRQVQPRGDAGAVNRARLHAAAAGGQPQARPRYPARHPRQPTLPYGLCEPPGAPAALAGGRGIVVRRPRRRRAPFVSRLSGRGPVGRVCGSQGLVPAREVATRLPLDPGGSPAGLAAAGALRQPRLRAAARMRASLPRRVSR
jgi:hypothetical protein